MLIFVIYIYVIYITKLFTIKLRLILTSLLVVIIIIGGAAWSVNSSDFVSTSQIEVRITCDSKQLLVSSTKVPGFPNPERTLQYYLDRYNDEPNYKDWFDRNFPDQTVQEVVC